MEFSIKKSSTRRSARVIARFPIWCSALFTYGLEPLWGGRRGREQAVKPGRSRPPPRLQPPTSPTDPPGRPAGPRGPEAFGPVRARVVGGPVQVGLLDSVLTAASHGRLTAPQDCEAAHHVWWRRAGLGPEQGRGRSHGRCPAVGVRAVLRAFTGGDLRTLRHRLRVVLQATRRAPRGPSWPDPKMWWPRPVNGARLMAAHNMACF
jgi:hypothetical protein